MVVELSIITGLTAGRLDRRITIQAATEAQSSTGAMILSYTTQTPIWAEVRDPNMREIQAAQQMAAQADRIFLIRWSTAVTFRDRILYDDGLGERSYEILGPPEELGRRSGLRIQGRVLRAT